MQVFTLYGWPKEHTWEKKGSKDIKAIDMEDKTPCYNMCVIGS
jgi:hypothetical protein